MTRLKGLGAYLFNVGIAGRHKSVSRSLGILAADKYLLQHVEPVGALLSASHR